MVGLRGILFTHFFAATVAVFPLGFVGGALAADYSPAAVPGSGGRVCVERFEENGSLNIWPLYVAFGSEAEVRLSGGTATCMYLPTGKYSVSLRWDDAEGKAHDGGVQSVEIARGSSAYFAICNTKRTAKAGGEWVSGWIVAPTSEAVAACGIPTQR